MTKRTALLLVSAICAAGLAQANGDAFTVRAGDNGRTWQVNYEPSAPIVWAWPAGATAASLTVTSHLGKVSVSTYSFTREDGADTGSWPIPASPSTEERLYDLALEIRAASKVIEMFSARVVCLPDSFDLLSTNMAGWAYVHDRSPRPVPYDNEWCTGSVESAGLTLTAAGGVPVAVPLLGKSGFEPLDLSVRLGANVERFSASLAFDGEDALYEADLCRVVSGLTICIR